jgi:hypothetical protein
LTTVRRGGIGPCVAERSETGFPIGDRRERVQEVACRSRQAVEPRYHQHVAGDELAEHAAKLRPVGLGSARHFAEHFSRPGGAKLAHLCRLALPVRRYPRIAVNHGFILHRISEPKKGNFVNGLVLVRTS